MILTSNADMPFIKNILVVDDEKIIRELLGNIIEILGYNPILCGLPTEAVKIFEDYHDEISLVFIDMIMPKLNGRQLYGELTKIDAEKKVIMLSGYTVKSEIECMLEDGIYGFVKKPISIKEVSNIIKKAIC